MPFEGYRVSGLRELQTAFAKFGAAEKLELRAALIKGAEPVRSEAESLAVREIRNMGSAWSRMRVGVTTTLVYVAPAKRRSRNRNLARPNLAPLLMDRAMSPALETRGPEAIALIDYALGQLGDEWAA